MFFMILIYTFALNSNPMSASLKSQGIFVSSRPKVNVKVKYYFLTNEARNKCNTSFLCDFDWAIHFSNYFDYSRSSSRSKGKFQGQFQVKILFLTINMLQIGVHIIHCLGVILTRSMEGR